MAQNTATVDVEIRVAEIPHFEQYFGLWAIHQDSFRQMVEYVESVQIIEHVKANSVAATQDGRTADQGYAVEDGVAIIDVLGSLTKYGSSFSQNPGMVRLKRAVRNAANDPVVRGVLLRIDSPGGTVAGTGDFADEVSKTNKIKPVHAFIEDLGASGAYWVASQAGRVVANRGAIVGSIGVYSVIYDYSQRAEKLGVKVHVIRAGAFKGAGVEGTEITEEQIAEWQRNVNDLNDLFVAAVARGRNSKMTPEQVRSIADGRVHIGDKAKQLGLVDSVESIDEALAALRAQFSGGYTRAKAAGQKKESVTMAEHSQDSPTPVTLKELKKEFPESTAEWRESVIEDGMSMEDARVLWSEELAEQKRSLEKQVADLKSQVEEGKKKTEEKKSRAGIDALNDSSTGESEEFGGDPVAEFDKKVRALVDQGENRQRAAVRVAKENKALHEAYLRATNKSTKAVQELITERFA